MGVELTQCRSIDGSVPLTERSEWGSFDWWETPPTQTQTPMVHTTRLKWLQGRTSWQGTGGWCAYKDPSRVPLRCLQQPLPRSHVPLLHHAASFSPGGNLFSWCEPHSLLTRPHVAMTMSHRLTGGASAGPLSPPL